MTPAGPSLERDPVPEALSLVDRVCHRSTWVQFGGRTGDRSQRLRFRSVMGLCAAWPQPHWLSHITYPPECMATRMESEQAALLVHCLEMIRAVPECGQNPE